MFEEVFCWVAPKIRVARINMVVMYSTHIVMRLHPLPTLLSHSTNLSLRVISSPFQLKFFYIYYSHFIDILSRKIANFCYIYMFLSIFILKIYSLLIKTKILYVNYIFVLVFGDIYNFIENILIQSLCYMFY